MSLSGRVGIAAVIPGDDAVWLYLNVRHTWARLARQCVLCHPTQTGRFTAEPQCRRRVGVHGSVALDHHAPNILPRRATLKHQAYLGVALNIFDFLGAGPAAEVNVIAEAKVTQRHTVRIAIPSDG